MSNKEAVSYAGLVKAIPGSIHLPEWPHQTQARMEMDAKIPLRDGAAYAGLLVVPTGGGKTFIAVRWLLSRILGRKKKVLWIAHRHELLEQAFLTIKNNAYSEIMLPETESFRFRIISGLHDKPVNVTRNDDIIIAGKDSLNKGLGDMIDNWLAPDDEVFLVVDEAHHSTAKTYRKIINALQGGDRVFRMLGLTATPFRTLESEQGLLGKLFVNDIVYKVDLRSLIAQGILAEPVFEEVRTEMNLTRDLTTRDIKTIQASDTLPEHIARQISESNERHAMIVSRYVENQERYGPLIVFAVNINHAIVLNTIFNIELNRHFNSQGRKYSEYVVGDITDIATGVRVSSEDNKQKIKDFRDGKIKVLVNVLILTEGIDLPNAQTVFLTRPTMSTILMTQMIGRVLRGKRAGGKEKAYIVSFIDDWQEKISWVSPETVVIEKSGQFDDEDEKRFRRVVRLIAIGKIEEFAKMMHEQIQEIEALPFLRRIPVGIYSFSILMPPSPKNGDALEKNCEVLVFDHQLPSYKDFVQELPQIFKAGNLEEQEYLSDDQLDHLLEIVEDSYFANHDYVAAQWKDDIKDILRYYAQTEASPVFLKFEDRDKCDLAKEAEHIYVANLRAKDQGDYEDSIWNDENKFWQVLFGHRKDYFLRQLSIEMEKLKHPVDFNQDRSEVAGAEIDYEQVPIENLSLWQMRKANPKHWRELYDAVFAKHTDADGYITCAGSGFRSKHRRLFQIDHIVPISKGGQSVIENLRVVARWVNAAKGDNVEGLCVKCGKKRLMLNPQKGMTTAGRYRLTGTCAECGARMSIFVPGHSTEES